MAHSSKTLFKPVCGFATLLLVGSSPVLLGQEPEGPAVEQRAMHGYHHSFHDVGKYAKLFESKERDKWQQPERVVEALDLKPGSSVADLGAGTGYFSRRFSQAVGPEGKVYAIDAEPAMADYLKKEVQEKDLKNVTVKLVKPGNPDLAPQSVDLIFICTVLHHVDNRIDYLRKLSECLRPGGRIALIDFKPNSPVGPPPAHRLSEEEAKEEFQKAGYRLLKAHDFLPYQYFLEFVPAA
ncbi:class I SAM-dependent methyltransferase [Methylacidimicrobium tartarophylax]|uniref:Aklanonic acid methyltransferase DnrC n=1 Tax=Methylacidimicrobium tartarophylax TaxID=1041768 RepID=A0A5E6MGC2_9BACT|nr:class I SAM-dependent methyltransferase [Methylacidimicrobium tartarophylax]VVM08161.1 Aklanonic acid methyltransferase DnrC [Methylacidimicrobium tartarophylax]